MIIICKREEYMLSYRCSKLKKLLPSFYVRQSMFGCLNGIGYPEPFVMAAARTSREKSLWVTTS
jgi:hypothetical protein